MKIGSFTKAICLIFITGLSSLGFSQSNFELQLRTISEIDSIEKIDNHSFFKETFIVYIDQYLDHQHPENGTFKQRVIISNHEKNQPVVFVTEGYRAGYATRSSYINELSSLAEANQIVVEHRFFGQSVPDDINWEYLTIENACHDLNRIHTIFSSIYPNSKWLATGISKGGQNTMAYSAFHPGDMDVYVPYVGPVNMAIEDKKMERFIRKVATKEQRKAVQDFQLNILKNRKSFTPLLDSLIETKQYTYTISNEAVLDFTVLEYSFAYWQWGHNSEAIPADTSSIQVQFDHLIQVSGPDYFSTEGVKPIKSFFVQTLKDFGYYGYDVKPFKKYLFINDAENYIEEVFLQGQLSFDYSNQVSKFIRKEVKKTDQNMILIYGEYDPWTGGAVKPKSESAHLFIKEEGSHFTRINNLPSHQKEKVIALLEEWLK